MEPTKERIEREAEEKYADWTGFLAVAYINGATAENERAQQELQAYRDIIKELIPYMEQYTAQKAFFMDLPGRIEEVHKMKAIIDDGKKLIDTVTPTSNPEQS